MSLKWRKLRKRYVNITRHINMTYLWVQDMWQESDDTELFAVTLFLECLLVGELDHFRGRKVDHVALLSPRYDVAGRPSTVVVFGWTLLAGLEILDGGVPLDAVTLGKGLVNSRVNSTWEKRGKSIFCLASWNKMLYHKQAFLHFRFEKTQSP